MADDTDFGVLYDALALGPGCTFDELKKAYRRQVAMLHPDVPGRGADVAQLQRINRLYRAATDFHRVHGRLPGAAAPSSAMAPAHPAMPAAQPPAHMPCARDVAAPGGHLRYILLAGLVVALLAWLFVRGTPDPTPAKAGSRSHPAADPRGRTGSGTGDMIVPGVDAAQVHAIMGEPLHMSEAQWDYGPSWIAFRCGKVSDWYSSPLRPLRVKAQRPATDEAGEMPQRC